MTSHPDPESTAADWLVRLEGAPLAPSEQAALDAWLAADPAHRAALDEARAAWADLGRLRRQPSSPRPVRATPHARLAAMAAAALLMLCLSAWWSGDPRLLLIADHRTGPGDLAVIALADGSRIDLDAGSALAVRFDGQQRRVDLLAGRAVFTAAPIGKDEPRPFVVAAAGGQIRALGTQFQVDLRPGGAEVVVSEHRVAVTVGDQRTELGAGQAVVFASAGTLAAPQAAAPGLAMAWRRGRLVFDRVPLAEVVETLNRYRRGGIVIADTALAARVVSGAFNSDDPAAALEAIARETGARILAAPPLVTLLY